MSIQPQISMEYSPASPLMRFVQEQVVELMELLLPSETTRISLYGKQQNQTNPHGNLPGARVDRDGTLSVLLCL